MALSVHDRARRKAPGAAFARVAETVLPGWELSLAFVNPAEATRLNQTLRKKTYTPNVLSYAVGKKSGEIIICPSEAAKQAPLFELSEANFTLLLFIHGCLHLKGWAHGVTMERRERKLLAQFALKDVLGTSSGDRRNADVAKNAYRDSLNVTTHRNRHRHRHVPGKAGRGRRSVR